MFDKKLPFYSFLTSSAVLLYIFGVAFLMSNGEKIFGHMPHVLGVVAFLLLFVFSALVTGLLILGGPLYLYFEQEKKQALKWLVYNVCWLFTIIMVVFATLSLSKI